MTSNSRSVVAVELDAAELGGPTPIGTLRHIAAPTDALVAFSYDEEWIGRPDAFVIDPSHGLYPGEQYPRSGTVIAPIFTDSAPDRWGRRY